MILVAGVLSWQSESMGRAPRITEVGVAYDLSDRRVMRLRISEKDRNEEVLKAVRQSAMRGMRLVTDGWKARIAARLGLGITHRPRGRPRKQHDEREESSSDLL